MKNATIMQNPAENELTVIPRGWRTPASSPEAMMRSRTEIRFHERLERDGRLREWEAYLVSALRR